MTRFEKDLMTAKANSTEAERILRKREAELIRIKEEGKREKNGYRRQCLAQEYARLNLEYDELLEA